jgi:glyoxalase family protein
MVSRIIWRVASTEALDFWQERLRRDGIEAVREGRLLTFADPEGLGFELVVEDTDDEPLVAVHPEIPAPLALQGFAGVRAYSLDPNATGQFLERTLSFTTIGADMYEARGERRGAFYACARTTERGTGGAGTVHHVAWTSTTDEHDAWRRRVLADGGSPTPIIDRFYFRSIYFREPGGVLFEIATPDPGFTADEPFEHLGGRLSLPPRFEPLRAQLEQILTPLPNPREGWTRVTASAPEEHGA